MKNRGFIKLYRSMLSKPEMTDLVNEQGAVGFGVYMMIVLYLCSHNAGRTRVDAGRRRHIQVSG